MKIFQGYSNTAAGVLSARAPVTPIPFLPSYPGTVATRLRGMWLASERLIQSSDEFLAQLQVALSKSKGLTGCSYGRKVNQQPTQPTAECAVS